ncbi:MAG: hypothetical protein APR62_11320 [Smithella sp. SDB]|nr:MAG: hypothetical protein APR62_11320 [Smithella sp. SDB]
MTSYLLNTTILFTLAVALIAGMGLGAFYFIVLWWMVQRLPQAKSPTRLMIGSFIIRMAVILTGFYLVMGNGHWERLAAAMLGFIIIRKILTYRLGPQNTADVY